MPKRGFTQVPLFVCLLAWIAGSAPAGAELWRSPLHDMAYVHVEKKLKDHPGKAPAGLPVPGPEALAPLPEDVLSGAGPHALEYEAFLAGYLPPAAAEALTTKARGRALAAATGIERTIHLPWSSFQPGVLAGRNDAGVTPRIPPKPVPGLCGLVGNGHAVPLASVGLGREDTDAFPCAGSAP